MGHQIVYISILIYTRLSITETDFFPKHQSLVVTKKKKSCENITGATLIIRLKVIAHTLDKKKYAVKNDNYVIKRIVLTHIFRKQVLYNVNDLKSEAFLQ